MDKHNKNASVERPDAVYPGYRKFWYRTVVIYLSWPPQWALHIPMRTFNNRITQMRQPIMDQFHVPINHQW